MPRERQTDRRSGTRFEIIGRLPSTVDTVTPVIMRNLSRGGALFEAHWRLPVNSRHTVRLDSAAGPADVQIEVRSVRHAPGANDGPRFLLGVEFVDPDHTLLEIIDGLVSQP